MLCMKKQYSQFLLSLMKLCLICSMISNSNAQTLFEYDNSGNRIKRYNITAPDLRPLINMSNRGFIKPTEMSRPFVIKVANVGSMGSVTTGTIKVFVSVGSNFNIELNGSSVWSITDDGLGEYTLTSNIILPRTNPATFSEISLTMIAKSTISKGLYSISILIDDYAGGELNGDNNGLNASVVVSTID